MIEPWFFMSWKKAFQYLYLGVTLSATEAQEWGLINEVVPGAQLEERVEEVASRHRPHAVVDDHGDQDGCQAGVGDDGHASPPSDQH